MLVRKSVVAAVLIWLGGVVVALYAPSLLPERYYYDAATIRDLIADPVDEHSPSFHATARIYAWLGMGTLLPEFVARIFGVTVAIVVTLWGSRLTQSPWRPALAVLLVAWAIPIAIYHGQYSKEVFAIVTIASMLRLSVSASGVAAAAALAVLYAGAFRNYWVVTIVLWLTLVALWRAGLDWPSRLLLMIVATFPLSVASEHFVGLWLSDGRTVTVEGREGEVDSATVFFNLLANTSPLTDIANTVIGWLTLLFPFYLLAVGAAQHIAFALFQFLNTVLFIRAAGRLPSAAWGRRSPAFDWQCTAAASWCLAYTFVQGMLEPDFGSFVKHETNLLPMLMFMLAWTRDRESTARRNRSEEPARAA